MKTHCDLCGKQSTDLMKVYDSSLEFNREVCPQCVQRINESNEMYLRATLYGCAGVITAFGVIVVIVAIFG